MEDRTPDFSVKSFLLPHMNPEGMKFVMGAFALTCLVSVFFIPFILPGLLLTYGIYLFFRDPERVPPLDEKLVVSPADGMVCMVAQVPLPEEIREKTAEEIKPEQLPEAGLPKVEVNLDAEVPAVPENELVWRVSVFMSVLNVHVNRMPASGTIIKKVYVPGAFLNASLDKASKDNERMVYLMRTECGKQLAFVQIAGLVARRIVSFTDECREMKRSERFGLIRFGSRVDVYLPQGVAPTVQVGQIMVAGETPIASL